MTDMTDMTDGKEKDAAKSPKPKPTTTPKVKSPTGGEFDLLVDLALSAAESRAASAWKELGEKGREDARPIMADALSVAIRLAAGREPIISTEKAFRQIRRDLRKAGLTGTVMRSIRDGILSTLSWVSQAVTALDGRDESEEDQGDDGPDRSDS